MRRRAKEKSREDPITTAKDTATECEEVKLVRTFRNDNYWGGT